MRSRKRKRRPNSNGSAINELEESSSSNEEEDIGLGRGDFPNITEGGDIQVREDHQCKNNKNQARTSKQPDEAPNKRPNVDSTISKRSAIKRSSDKTGDPGSNKKKKEEELKHDSRGEGPSAPIIELTARRGNKRTYKREDPNHQKKFKQGTAGVSGTPPVSPPETPAASHILERLIFHSVIGEGSFGKEHIIFIMEYLSGGDLYQLIERSAPLGDATTRFLTAEIICGLQFLHSRDIIHRDIKPENVLLDADGHAKIGDFGLAVKDTNGQKMLGAAGTVGYMAPEMHRRNPYDAMADIFSLGVMVFEMATGYQPFYCGEETMEEVIKSVPTDDPVYPEKLSHSIINIIKRFLCKSPERRHQLYINIRGHIFFWPINWEDLEAGRTCPPFKMQPTPVTICKHHKLDDLVPPQASWEPPITEVEEHRFHGYSFVSDRWKTKDNQ